MMPPGEKHSRQKEEQMQKACGRKASGVSQKSKEAIGV